jgi:hypothetical protein
MAWSSSIRPPSNSALGFRGLVGLLELEDVGHWIQQEASAEISVQLARFLRIVNPA